jgi:hypothetical protein
VRDVPGFTSKAHQLRWCALSATAFLAPIKHVAKKTWTDRLSRRTYLYGLGGLVFLQQPRASTSKFSRSADTLHHLDSASLFHIARLIVWGSDGMAPSVASCESQSSTI